MPEIVERILRSRHDFEGQDFLFNLVREYPRREQVMQYGESALTYADLKIESLAGRVEISAPEELLIHCGGAYLRIKDGEIELGAPGNIYLKAAHVQKLGGTTVDTPPTPLPLGYSAGFLVTDEAQVPRPFTRYRITTQQGEVFNGVTDKDGKTLPVHTELPMEIRIEFPDTVKEKPDDFEEPDELEEEEELTDGITLRLGLFFDGTGNNQANALATAQCRREDLIMFNQSEMQSIEAV